MIVRNIGLNQNLETTCIACKIQKLNRNVSMTTTEIVFQLITVDLLDSDQSQPAKNDGVAPFPVAFMFCSNNCEVLSNKR